MKCIYAKNCYILFVTYWYYKGVLKLKCKGFNEFDYSMFLSKDALKNRSK